MTAARAGAGSDDELRAALADVLRQHHWAVVATSEVGTDRYGCPCGARVAGSPGAMDDHRAAEQLAVVRAYADQRAAEELEAEARVNWADRVRWSEVRLSLRTRAAALAEGRDGA